MGLGGRASEYGKVVSSQHVADVSAATALTVPAAAQAALVTVLLQAVRYRSDGTDPTNAVGHYVAANGTVELFGSEIDTVKFIEATAASTADLFVTYYRD